jgi:cyclic pyranopterin phosphate synthase
VVRFIEYMDVGTLNGWRLEDVVPSKELLERIDAEMPLVPVEKRHPGEVADRYRYADDSGEIGFISSVSQPFCGDCVRARLSADGTLHTCLFATDGTDFRGPLRDGATDDELSALLRSVWRRRGDRYSERRTARTRAVGEGSRTNGAGGEAAEGPEADRVEMFRMGG